MTYVIGILFAIYTASWRRWFGGATITSIAWINKRATKTVINLIAMSALLFFMCGFVVWETAVIAFIVQFLFWAKAHGCYFDMGLHDASKNPETIKRYNDTWYDKYIQLVIVQGLKQKQYGFAHDFTGMLIRYTLPCIPLIYFFGIGILLMGVSIPLIYTIFRWREVLSPQRYVWSEHIAGLVCGLCMAFL